MDELAEFEPSPPSDGMKIQWFQEGIHSDMFAPIRATIMTNREKFSTFEAVKDAYMDFARQQIRHDHLSPRERKCRSVSAVQGHSGSQSSNCYQYQGCGYSGRDNDAKLKAAFPLRSRLASVPKSKTRFIHVRSTVNLPLLRGNAITNYGTPKPSWAQGLPAVVAVVVPAPYPLP